MFLFFPCSTYVNMWGMIYKEIMCKKNLGKVMSVDLLLRYFQGNDKGDNYQHEVSECGP